LIVLREDRWRGQQRGQQKDDVGPHDQYRNAVGRFRSPRVDGGTMTVAFTSPECNPGAFWRSLADRGTHEANSHWSGFDVLS
jgi:hypothetical protein